MNDKQIDAEMARLFEADHCDTRDGPSGVVRSYENRRGQRFLVEIDGDRVPTVYTFCKNLMPKA